MRFLDPDVTESAGYAGLGGVKPRGLFFDPNPDPTAGDPAGVVPDLAPAPGADITPAAPAGIPSGHEAIASERLAALNQGSEFGGRMRGMLATAGIEGDLSEHDLALIQAVRGNAGHDAQTLNDMLYGPSGVFTEAPPANGADPNGNFVAREDVEKMFDERLAQRDAMGDARRSHETGVAQEEIAISAMREALGISGKPEEDDVVQQILGYAMNGAVGGLYSAYGDDHLLNGQYQPLHADSLKPIQDLFTKFTEMNEIRTLLGVANKQRADPVNRTPVQPAGSPVTGGELDPNSAPAVSRTPTRATRKKAAEEFFSDKVG